jgi:hypothetical protein
MAGDLPALTEVKRYFPQPLQPYFAISRNMLRLHLTFSSLSSLLDVKTSAFGNGGIQSQKKSRVANANSVDKHIIQT